MLGLLRLRQTPGFPEQRTQYAPLRPLTHCSEPDPLVAVLETRQEAAAYLLLEIARQPVDVLLAKFLPLLLRLLLSVRLPLRTHALADARDRRTTRCE